MKKAKSKKKTARKKEDDVELIKRLADEVDRRASARPFSSSEEDNLAVAVVSEHIEREFGIQFMVGRPFGDVSPEVSKKAMARCAYLVEEVKKERARRLEAIQLTDPDAIFPGE